MEIKRMLALCACALLAGASVSAEERKSERPFPADGVGPKLNASELFLLSRNYGEAQTIQTSAETPAKDLNGDLLLLLDISVPKLTKEAKRVARVKLFEAESDKVLLSQEVQLTRDARLEPPADSPDRVKHYRTEGSFLNRREVEIPAKFDPTRHYRWFTLAMPTGPCANLRAEVELPGADGQWEKSSRFWFFTCSSAESASPAAP